MSIFNPAAVAAYARGDMENYIVAATPGGIEAQEKAGQALLVASNNMPKKLRPDRASFERLGFQFGTDVDKIFVHAKLPPGWTRAATGHDMYSHILDERGRKRVEVFYKAAFYDRNASARLCARFTAEAIYPEGDRLISDDALIPVAVMDGGKEIHRVGSVPYRDRDSRWTLIEEGERWLTVNRPGWRDVVESWNL